MGERKTKLNKISLFDGIPEGEALAELECMGTAVAEYPRDHCIIREGENSDRFGVVISGSVRVERTDETGNRHIILSVGEGELFGVSSVLLGDELPQGVYANSDCRILLLRRDLIYAPCSGGKYHHRMILNILRSVAEADRRLYEKIEILSKRTTREKLLAYLSSESQKHGSGEFDIPFDRQGLADYLCVERSALSAEIGRMRSDGLIIARRSHFILL